MAKIEIKAEKRDSFGSASSRRLRKAGKVTVDVWQVGAESLHLNVNSRELIKTLKSVGEEDQVVLKVGRKSYKVKVKESQWDPVSRQLIHCEFVTAV